MDKYSFKLKDLAKSVGPLPEMEIGKTKGPNLYVHPCLATSERVPYHKYHFSLSYLINKTILL